jgi:hypothetical protein
LGDQLRKDIQNSVIKGADINKRNAYGRTEKNGESFVIRRPMVETSTDDTAHRLQNIKIQNDKLRNMWKKVAVAYFKVLLFQYLFGLKRTTQKTSVSVASSMADIQTG